MNRTLLLLLLWVPALGPTAAAQRPVRLYAHAGPVSPIGPNAFVDFWNTGLHVGAAVGVRVAGPLELVAGVDYRAFPLEKDEFLADAGILGVGLELDGGGIMVTSGTLRAKANLEASPRFAPYAALGVGLYRRTLDDLMVSAAGEQLTLPGETETTLGFEVAVGIGVILSPRLHFFAEPVFTLFATEFKKPSFNREVNLTEDNNTQFLTGKFGVVVDL